MKSFKEFLEEGGVNRSGVYKRGAKLTIKTKKGQESAVIVKALKGNEEGTYIIKTTKGKEMKLHWSKFDINE